MDLNKKRCGCGQVHRVRETCPKCAEKRRQELEQTRPRKETPVPGYGPDGWYAAKLYPRAFDETGRVATGWQVARSVRALCGFFARAQLTSDERFRRLTDRTRSRVSPYEYWLPSSEPRESFFGVRSVTIELTDEQVDEITREMRAAMLRLEQWSSRVWWGPSIAAELDASGDDDDDDD